MRFLAIAGFVLLLAVAAAVAPPAQAAGFRCDTELVRRGMTPLEVLERCGDPVYELGWTEFRYPGLFVRVDEWTYEFGRNKFRRLLTFEDGRLIRVETRSKPTGGWRPSSTGGTSPALPR